MAEQVVAWHALVARGRRRKPLEGTLRVELRFYRGDKRHVDSDNLAKLVLDALNGVAWVDDSQITLLSVDKHLDRGNPRTEIAVHTLSG
jgi:Holliday junction resolvase RusA-like endonuclease